MIVKVDLLLIAVAALLVTACTTSDQHRTQIQHQPTSDLDSMIDGVVNDKKTWVDPATRARP